LSEVNVDSDDFIAFVNSSNSIDELEAINESVVQEIAVQRAKDTGGEGGKYGMMFETKICIFVEK